MKRFDFELRKHVRKCGTKEFLAVFGHGCCARGTEYIVQCTKCKEMVKAGKNPGRREYFSGTDEEYAKGTIIEELNAIGAIA